MNGYNHLKHTLLAKGVYWTRKYLLNIKPIQTLNNKITSMKNHLHTETSFIDYVYVITKLLVSNDTNISNIRINQGTRLHKLFWHNSYHISVTFHDPDKVIFNFRVMSSTLLKNDVRYGACFKEGVPWHSCKV